MTMLRCGADGLVFIGVRDGPVAHTLELETGVHLDVGDAGQAMGLEFLDAADIPAFLARHGGTLRLPADLDRLARAARRG